MKSKNSKIAKPSLWYFLTEIPRAIIEFFQTIFFLRKYNYSKTSNGHPILVIPGFMASDSSTRLLRRFLKRLGFAPYGWGIGRNYANLEDVDVLRQKMDELYSELGTSITLIGWSLGGIYARQLAKEKPEMVDQLITIGSPYMGIKEPNRAERTYKMLKRGQEISDIEEEWVNHLPDPIATPTSSIYSKKDGIVSWRTCCEECDYHNHRNIEANSSHLGMGWNKNVLQIIADQLFRGHSHIHSKKEKTMTKTQKSTILE